MRLQKSSYLVHVAFPRLSARSSWQRSVPRMSSCVFCSVLSSFRTLISAPLSVWENSDLATESMSTREFSSSASSGSFADQISNFGLSRMTMLHLSSSVFLKASGITQENNHPTRRRLGLVQPVEPPLRREGILGLARSCRTSLLLPTSCCSKWLRSETGDSGLSQKS